MALTGLIWYGFLVGHLVGNLLLLAGDGGAAFELYADFLEAATQFVVPTEVILILALAVHIYCAVTLSREASAARPVAYRRLRAVGSRSLASQTMIWSGLVIAGFLALPAACASPTAPSDTGSASVTTSSSPLPVTPAATNPSFEQRVLTLVNQKRATGATCNGTPYPPVAPLSMDPILRQAARDHSADLALDNYFSHAGLDARSFSDRIRDAG